MYRSVFIVEQTLYLQRTQMRDVVGGNTIVITEIPLALEKDDGMMGRPAHYGVKYDTLIGEGSIGIVADGIAEHVAVACRVRKIVFVFVFMHPPK